MRYDDELADRLTARLRAKRRPTIGGMILAVILVDLLKGMALMVLLGIVASMVSVPGLAVGYPTAYAIYWLWSLVSQKKV